jgi:hypothetical protein
VALQLFKDLERRDPAEVLGDGLLPRFIEFQSQRGFVRHVVEKETQLRKRDTEFVDESEEGASSLTYRTTVNASGSPSRNASATWTWSPGTELVRDAEAFKEAA